MRRWYWLPEFQKYTDASIVFSVIQPKMPKWYNIFGWIKLEFGRSWIVEITPSFDDGAVFARFWLTKEEATYLAGHGLAFRCATMSDEPTACHVKGANTEPTKFPKYADTDSYFVPGIDDAFYSFSMLATKGGVVQVIDASGKCPVCCDTMFYRDKLGDWQVHHCDGSGGGVFMTNKFYSTAQACHAANRLAQEAP